MAVARAVPACVLTAVMLAATLAGIAPAAAQAPYPNKPIRMIVPYPPGAGTDFTAREIGKAINEALGQPVVIDHRPGAAATVGHGLVAKAAPDGYTLGLATTGGMVSGPALMGNRIAYDPLKDFTHIGLATYVFYAVFVNAGLPANNMREFIALAKTRPGKLNYSSPGVGHTQRIKLAPDVQAINETVPGYYNTGWWGLIAPAGLPKEIVDKLNPIMNKALQSPDYMQRFFVNGLEIATSTPKGYTDIIRDDLQSWRKLIKAANISVESLP